MDPLVSTWTDIAADSPIPLIHRQTVTGANALVARVRLEPGCHVAPHHHVSEQIAIIVSGRVRWNLGEKGTSEYREVEVTGGQVVHLPSNFTHGVDAIEETIILDILSPVGAMGIDSQKQ